MIRKSKKREVKEKYTNKDYWDRYWGNEKREDITFYFSDIVNKYIDWSQVQSYMEIGGAPGSIMAYLHKKHNLAVSTIDFTERRVTEEYLDNQGIHDYEILQEDFLTFDVSGFGRQYDLVASWGFVEHFAKNQSSLLIEKHKRLVRDKGYLIIEIPNIRKFFWLMYFLFNRDLIKIHNLEIMNLKWLKEQIMNGGEFNLLYAGYHIAINEQNEYFVEHEKQKKFCKGIINFIKKLRIGNEIKCLFFPYILLVAQKKR